MKLGGMVLCVILFQMSNRPSFASALTLYTNSSDLRMWPSLAYDVSTVNLCGVKSELSFEFKTFLSDAIVLYQDDGGEQNFVAINLKKGRLHFTAEFGGERLTHRSRETFNDFEWHLVNVRLKCPRPCFEVTTNNKRLLYRRHYRKRCEMKTNLQIGAFDWERLENTNTITFLTYFFVEYFRLPDNGER